MPSPGQLLTRGSSTEDVVKQGKWSYELVRHVSFVDCPGHDILMATMLNGAAVMDAALLLIAGNEPCPQPQTSEHLAAVEIMKLQHIIILQNKIDLVKEAAALQQHEDIKAFVKGTVADSAPVVPMPTCRPGSPLRHPRLDHSLQICSGRLHLQPTFLVLGCQPPARKSE